jgi:molybdopterin/thiamine biosynthesis adenylyltransferase
MIMLSEKEKERYSRQMMDFGKEAQEKLAKSTVTVIGAGGLGSPVLEYLARAGVGRLIIIDRGEVVESNLNRQFFTESDIGRPKASASKERLEKVNPHIRIEALDKGLADDNARELLKGSDVVVETLDNLNTRKAASRACRELGIPLVHGAVEGWKGYQLTCLPGGSYLEHLEGKEAKEGAFPIIGATAGVIGSIQALEAIKLITGKGEPNTELLIFDGKDNITERAKLK